MPTSIQVLSKISIYDIKCLHCRSIQGVHVTCNMSYGATVRASAANSNFLYLFLYYYTKLYYIFIYSFMLGFLLMIPQAFLPLS